MTTDDSRPTIPHAARCGRRSAPILRASWKGAPELWCPDCGRHAPADDTRPPRPTPTTDPERPQP